MTNAVLRPVLVLECLLLALPLPMLTAYLMHCCGESIRRGKLFRIALGLWSAYFVMVISSLLTDAFFYILPDRNYSRGPWFPLMLLPMIATVLLDLTGVIQRRKRLSRKAFLSFLLALLPVTGILLVHVFVDVRPCETPEAMDRLCEAYVQAVVKESIDALIRILCFVVDFLCIHPFNDGNGRMSRLLTLLLLYKNGYSVGKYISIEKQIEKTKDRYYDVLEMADTGWHEEKNDPTPFIRYMLMVSLTCYGFLTNALFLLPAGGLD